MAAPAYLCLFDLRAYDRRVAPALRLYAHQYDPKGAVALLDEVIRRAPAGVEDYEHWADSIRPDAGHKPSERTVSELSDLLIRQFCLPEAPVALDQLAPWLSEHSEWFADLLNGGEELSGGSLEFTLGAGRLVATRQQIKQFRREIARIPPPPEPDLTTAYRNLRHLADLADTNASYTLLKTSWPAADHA